jgi:hypothetical protein
MHHTDISLPELFMLVTYLSFPVFVVARAIQWLLLKPFFGIGRLVLILLVSLVISFISTLVIWGEYPGNPTFAGFICIPAVAAEGIVLLMTYYIKRSLLKK